MMEMAGSSSRGYGSRPDGKVFRIPSTTAPMTWWILPPWAASVLARRAESAGAKFFWMGLKALRTAGR